METAHHRSIPIRLGTFMTIIFLKILLTAESQGECNPTPSNDPCGSQQKGRVLHDSHCTKYLLCPPGAKPTTMNCPAGTLFHTGTGHCDHKKKVDCAKQMAALGFLALTTPGKRTPSPGVPSGALNIFSEEPLYTEKVHKAPGMPAPLYDDDIEHKMDRIRNFLSASLQHVRRTAGLHFKNMTYEAKYHRGYGRPFRRVQGLLGNTAYGVGMSKSAYQVLLCMKDLKKRMGLSRREMYTVMQRIRYLPALVRPNHRRVVPDDSRPLVPDDTCPFPQAEGNDCDPYAPYRTIDGSCNNLWSPLWGKSMRALRRVIEPDYADGIGEPRADQAGHALPSARSVSSMLFRDVDRKSSLITIMHMTFGQFMDHDVGRTAVTKLVNDRSETVDIECGASGCEKDNPACWPITLPPGDMAATVSPCLMFVRSMEVLRDDCRLGPREQLNQVSSYLDASQIYGSSYNESDVLRDDYEGHKRGRLKVTQNYDHLLRPLLPQQDHNSCRDTNKRFRCFGAGDSRVNEQVGLASLHTIFHRYHNFLEDRLHKLNPHWEGELLFQEVRRILIGIWQHIVYNEYLPPTLGPLVMKRYRLNLAKKGYYGGYDSKTKADTLNSFQTAAFRFGHSQITSMIHMTDASYTGKKDVLISEIFNRPYEVYNNDNPGGSGVDSILFGQVSQPAMSNDPFFTKQITKHLFSENPPHEPGTDLPALNIQRGRDHGLAGYTRWRAWCGLSVPKTFDDLIPYMEPILVNNMKKLYRRVEDIDLFPGGIAEHLVKGAMVGPTFACIIGKQFSNFRVGDRFWYERQDDVVGFTSYQLEEIRKMTLAGVMCHTTDHMKDIQKYVMLQPLSEALNRYGATNAYLLQALYKGEKNERRPCSALPDLDLQAWADRKPSATPSAQHGNLKSGSVKHRESNKYEEIAYGYRPEDRYAKTNDLPF